MTKEALSPLVMEVKAEGKKTINSERLVDAYNALIVMVNEMDKRISSFSDSNIDSKALAEIKAVRKTRTWKKMCADGKCYLDLESVRK